MLELADPADPPLAEDTRVGDFRIRGLLGEGAMGQVYLAQDVRLGRRVALKLIRRSVMQGDAVARFLEEARATASFNHPHIVTLHAVGEHEGRPYLALEYLDGESLRARMAGGPLPVREALRYCRAVAEAIAEAHRRGVVHADLKPENVVIPRDGRVRVVDFGLARLAGGTPTSGSGTPAYMAPERWRGAPPTGAIDVWALGILLHELVAGRRPISYDTLARLAFSNDRVEMDLLAAPWAPLVRDCLALDPAARPTAEELVRRITALLDPRAGGAEGADRCPFPGLAAFSRDEAADYFGRRAELDALVEQLRTRALIPVIGPSGIGKSSFIRAALLPRLDEIGHWIAIALRPGASPFEGLAAALALPGHPAAEIAASLRRSPDNLSLVLGDVAMHHGARVLLFLDQFEEAFTLAADPADAIAFCDCLARAAAAAEPWRIVLTLRDDFLGRLAAAPSMRPHLGAVMLLGPLAAADLRAAVAGPLANVDFEADSPALIERIVDDVAGQPACLPLLQFTCRSLWERRDPAIRRILSAEYEAMGGATGALATHARRLMAELAPDEVRLVRGILLALIHPDGTRRPRRRADLLESLPASAHEVADRLIDRLLDRRLLVATRDAEADASTIEVAHEALATAWPQLARWLDETYEERVLVAELEQASQLWLRRGRRDDETWAGIALADTVRKVDAWSITLPPTSRAFLDASVRRDHRGRRRRRWIVGALGVAALGAVIAAVAFARAQQQLRRIAEEAARQEQLLRLVAEESARQEQQLRLAAENWGEFDLVLEPYDWEVAEQRRVRPSARPKLAWKLYVAGAGRYGAGDLWSLKSEQHELWRRIARREFGSYELERREAPTWRRGSDGFESLVERVKARSSAAVLEVARDGCAPSRVFLQPLPGYRGPDAAIPTLRVRVPTCQASRAGMVEIPAGEFYASVDADDPKVGSRDELRTLPAFRIDRTEVTREAFAIYDELEPLTGDAALSLPSGGDSPPRGLPVRGINYATALAYCEYMGKRLPSVEQWQKAYRGGIKLPSGDNPVPKRGTPWGPDSSAPRGNLMRPGVTAQVAPVGSFRDTSPYGVEDMAGNVSEWSRTLATQSKIRDFRIVLGAQWDTPLERSRRPILWRNVRPDRYLDFGLGLRCVEGPAAGDR